MLEFREMGCSDRNKHFLLLFPTWLMNRMEKNVNSCSVFQRGLHGEVAGREREDEAAETISLRSQCVIIIGGESLRGDVILSSSC